MTAVGERQALAEYGLARDAWSRVNPERGTVTEPGNRLLKASREIMGIDPRKALNGAILVLDGTGDWEELHKNARALYDEIDALGAEERQPEAAPA